MRAVGTHRHTSQLREIGRELRNRNRRRLERDVKLPSGGQRRHRHLAGQPAARGGETQPVDGHRAPLESQHPGQFANRQAGAGVPRGRLLDRDPRRAGLDLQRALQIELDDATRRRVARTDVDFAGDELQPIDRDRGTGPGRRRPRRRQASDIPPVGVLDDVGPQAGQDHVVDDPGTKHLPGPIAHVDAGHGNDRRASLNNRDVGQRDAAPERSGQRPDPELAVQKTGDARLDQPARPFVRPRRLQHQRADREQRRAAQRAGERTIGAGGIASGGGR